MLVNASCCYSRSIISISHLQGPLFQGLGEFKRFYNVAQFLATWSHDHRADFFLIELIHTPSIYFDPRNLLNTAQWPAAYHAVF